MIERKKKRYGASSEVAANTSTQPWCARHHFPKAVYLPRLIYSMKLLCVDMAKRIIEYKKKMSKQYFVPKEAVPSCGSDDDDGCDGKVPKLKIKV